MDEPATSQDPSPVADRAHEPLRVLIVARQPIARVGLRGLVREHPDLAIVGQAGSVEDAAQLAGEAKADVVLATWDTADVDEIVALAHALSALGAPLVLLADAAEAGELQHVLQAGARGILLAETSEEELVVGLRAAAQGLLVLDPTLGPSLALAQAAAVRPTALDEPLTEREHQVLELMAQGLPNKAIARRLSISEHTVKFHVGSILGKLDAGSRTDAVARAARRGLLAL